jgi:hypothetical protein
MSNPRSRSITVAGTGTRTRAFAAAMRRAVAPLVLGAAALAGVAGVTPATAAIVVGTFDPPFGPIANLGYSGTVTAFVPDVCFALPAGAFIPNADACSRGTMAVLSATVNFYNATANPSGTPIFANSGPVTFGAGAVNGVVTGFDNVSNQNELLGIDTAFSAPFAVALADAGGAGPTDDVAFNGTMSLRFFAIAPAQQIGPGPFYAAELQACYFAPDTEERICVTSNPAPTVFQRRSSSVAEPATAWLAVGALGAPAR